VDYRVAQEVLSVRRPQLETIGVPWRGINPADLSSELRNNILLALGRSETHGVLINSPEAYIFVEVILNQVVGVSAGLLDTQGLLLVERIGHLGLTLGISALLHEVSHSLSVGLAHSVLGISLLVSPVLEPINYGLVVLHTWQIILHH
jgi:hypothetical protein